MLYGLLLATLVMRGAIMNNESLERFMGRMDAHAEHVKEQTQEIKGSVSEFIKEGRDTARQVSKNTGMLRTHGKIFWLIGLFVIAMVGKLLEHYLTKGG